MPSALQPATEIPIQIGSHAVTLRASLRAAVALEALPGGIASLWDGVARQKLTPIHSVIRAAATDRREAEAFLAYAATYPLVRYSSLAQAACLALLSEILAPAQQGETTNSRPPADPIPLSRFFTELFSLATSWLGWPPSEVWNASVAEIVTALEAQAERELRLAGIPSEDKAGKAEQRQANLDAGLDPDFDRAGLLALKAKM